MRTPLVIVTSVATLLVVAGCALLPQAQPTAAPSSTAEAEASPSPSATSEPAPDAEATRDLPPCDSLITIEVMYDYNSNVALDNSYVAPGGGLVDRVAATGVECGWVNLTSQEVIAIGAGAPVESGLAAFQSEFGSWDRHSYGGIDGYFTVIAGEGHAAVITNGVVLVGVSRAFFEASDAEPLIAAALDAL